MEDEHGNSSGLWRDLAGHVRSSNQLLDGLRTRSGGLAGRGGPLGAEGYARGRRLGPRLLPSSKVLDGRGGGRESFGRKRSVGCGPGGRRALSQNRNTYENFCL